jgi:hypothetical protein
MIRRTIREALARTPLFDAAYYRAELLTSLNSIAGEIFAAPSIG